MFPPLKVLLSAEAKDLKTIHWSEQDDYELNECSRIRTDCQEEINHKDTDQTFILLSQYWKVEVSDT